MVRSSLRRSAPREDKTQLTNRAPGASPRRSVTRLQRHTHDVRAMSACAPTADVSL
jgi:hypothetical protein